MNYSVIVITYLRCDQREDPEATERTTHSPTKGEDYGSYNQIIIFIIIFIVKWNKWLLRDVIFFKFSLYNQILITSQITRNDAFL